MSTKALVVEVTAEDIATGVPLRAQECPIARALQRLGYPEAGCGVTILWLAEWNDDTLVDLPAEVSEFRVSFDSGSDVEPFSFTIEVPA